MVELRILFIFIVIYLVNKSKNADLNNIIYIEAECIEDIFPFQMPNKDFVFLSINLKYNMDTQSYTSDLLIYELKSSGEMSRDNIIEHFYLNHIKYLFTLLITDNNNYPLICDLNNCLSLDLIQLNYNSVDFHSLLQEDLPGSSYYMGFIININNKSKMLFSQISNNHIYLSIVNINDKDL